jgi:hypothetical protein
MAGWTATSIKIRTGTRFKSLPKSSPKSSSLTWAVLLGAAVGIAALGQAAPGQQSGQVSAGPGNSRDQSQIAVSVGAPSGKPGSLSGKLTDLHSTPLDGAIVVLRNTATGAEARTVTQKNGSYRFTGLAAGEYTLVAQSKLLGQGSLEGILVSAGTEARVQTAMRFGFSAQEPTEAAAIAQGHFPALTIASDVQSIASPVPATASPAQSIVSPTRTIVAAANPGAAPAVLEASMPITRAVSNSLVDHPDATRSQLHVGPPLETAILQAVVSLEPLESLALSSRQLTSLVRLTGPNPESPVLETAVVLSVLPTESPLSLALAGRPAASPIVVAGVASVAALAPESLPTPSLRAVTVGPTPMHEEWALEVVKGIALSHEAAQMALAQGRFRTLAASHQQADPVPPVVSNTLTAEQIQALPLTGRKWQNFVLDTPTASARSPGQSPSAHQGNATNPAETTIDGVSTRLAFGSPSDSGPRSAGSGPADGLSSKGMAVPWTSAHGLQVAESAIREVQSAAGNAEVEGARAGGGQVSVTTQQGGPGLHGQAFLFDRQNTWGARNPFTQWVTDTSDPSAPFTPLAPFNATPFPVFDNFQYSTLQSGLPQSYTPPDHETVWGVGVGSEWKKRKLFWFAALDSYHRNDPGVAMVKHPYVLETASCQSFGPCPPPPTVAGFFSLPTDDELQVLSARLGLGSANPLPPALTAYSQMLEALDGLLGPAPRTASQWVGFGRLDWQAAERHRFTLESIGARWNSPGGGLTRLSENYGNHSFGNSVASEEMLMARWEAFLTPNFMAVTQASAARNILEARPSTPSAFENTFLSGSAYGQLPQIVVDNRYGFTIGNPSRFGQGSYPDEHAYQGQEAVNWVRGTMLVKAGFELSHNADATSMLRNQTGTYTYSDVENFASDALAFAAFGINGELDPNNQRNCDQTGRVWTDSAGTVRGQGNLPCYSYYSQMIGPSGWHVSTNDWAGFATAQWQPARRVVISAGLRWERQQLPLPIAALNNSQLPLTQRTPSLGNDWGPRVSLAIGSGESLWPLLRLGYGMYFAQTSNQVIETALTQTGSFNGDLNFFMRPTDNCQFCAGGAPAFPYVLNGPPGSVVKPGAVEFAPQFHNPEIHQAVAAVEKTLPGHIQVTASALLSLGRRLPVPIDANLATPTPMQTITYNVCDQSPSGPNNGQCGNLGLGPIKAAQITVPFYASWPAIAGSPGWLNSDYQGVDQITSKANSTYEAGMLKVERYGRRGLTLHAHYTYGHAADWNPGESPLTPDIASQGTGFSREYGTSDLDVRHSAAIMAIYIAPWKLHGVAGKLANGWMLSAIGNLHSGLPYSMHTSGTLPKEFTSGAAAIVGLGPGMNGSGGASRVYGMGSDGVPYNIGRNTFRYPATWKADLRLGKTFDLGQMRKLELMAETFNLFNHQNVTELETTGYYIQSGTPPSTPGAAATPPTLNFLTGLKTSSTTGLPNPAFGQPLTINATDSYRERQVQVGLRLRF